VAGPDERDHAGCRRRVGHPDPASGPIPADEGEVNGQTLQVLSRLYWATGDSRYQLEGARIARAYLDLALPETGWVPTALVGLHPRALDDIGGSTPRS